VRKLPEIVQKKPLCVSYVHTSCSIVPFAQKACESEIFYAITQSIASGCSKSLTADTPGFPLWLQQVLRGHKIGKTFIRKSPTTPHSILYAGTYGMPDQSHML
jgi:hypothetical protein